MDNNVSKLESLLFSYAEPLSYKKIMSILDIEFDVAKKAGEDLAKRYVDLGSALEVIEVNLSLQLVVRSKYGDVVDKLFENDVKKGLTQAQLEVLSVIAYEQPVTRRDIERIRGIKSDRVVQGLIDLELVEVAGKKDAPGLPSLYATTSSFLRQFGIRTLADLPKLVDSDEIELFKK